MPFADIAKEKMYYATRGDRGIPVVFVHGAGDSHLVWNGQLAALSDTARAYAVDLPGHGRSAGPGRASVYDYAVAVREFIDTLGLGRAVVVGSSMGGAIAQTIALEFPDRVLALGLVGTGARLRVAPAFLEGLQNDFVKTASALVDNSFAPDASEVLKRQSEQQLLNCGQQVVYGDYAACDQFSIIDRISEIKAPTYVLCGSLDRMTPVKYSQFLASHIPDARLEIIEGAGHMVMVEKADEVSRALRQWIGGMQPG